MPIPVASPSTQVPAKQPRAVQGPFLSPSLTTVQNMFNAHRILPRDAQGTIPIRYRPSGDLGSGRGLSSGYWMIDKQRPEVGPEAKLRSELGTTLKPNHQYRKLNGVKK